MFYISLREPIKILVCDVTFSPFSMANQRKRSFIRGRFKNGEKVTSHSFGPRAFASRLVYLVLYPHSKQSRQKKKVLFKSNLKWEVRKK